jgi:hypothetical protein
MVRNERHTLLVSISDMKYQKNKATGRTKEKGATVGDSMGRLGS